MATSERTNWRKLNDLLESRSEGHCERCGFPVLMESAERHHRLLRSHGGQDSITNLVLLCPRCHQWCHANPKRALSTGFICHGWEDPAKRPVRLAAVGMALLTPEGWYELWFPGPSEVSE